MEDIEEIKDTNPADAKTPYEVKDGKLDPHAYQGWLRFALNCQVCHGAGGVGSAIAPDLAQKVKDLNKRESETIVYCGLRGNLGTGVMPSWAR